MPNSSQTDLEKYGMLYHLEEPIQIIDENTNEVLAIGIGPLPAQAKTPCRVEQTIAKDYNHHLQYLFTEGHAGCAGIIGIALNQESKFYKGIIIHDKGGDDLHSTKKVLNQFITSARVNSTIHLIWGNGAEKTGQDYRATTRELIRRYEYQHDNLQSHYLDQQSCIIASTKTGAAINLTNSSCADDLHKILNKPNINPVIIEPQQIKSDLDYGNPQDPEERNYHQSPYQELIEFSNLYYNTAYCLGLNPCRPAIGKKLTKKINEILTTKSIPQPNQIINIHAEVHRYLHGQSKTGTKILSKMCHYNKNNHIDHFNLTSTKHVCPITDNTIQ